MGESRISKKDRSVTTNNVRMTTAILRTIYLLVLEFMEIPPIKKLVVANLHSKEKRTENGTLFRVCSKHKKHIIPLSFFLPLYQDVGRSYWTKDFLYSIGVCPVNCLKSSENLLEF